MVMMMVVVAAWEVLGQARRRRRHWRGALDVPERRTACKGRGSNLLQIVMMVVMVVTGRCQTFHKHKGNQGNILVMVVPLCLFSPTPYRSEPTGAAFIVLLLQLSPLAPSGRLGHLCWRLLCIQVIAAEQASAAIGKLSPCGDRARDGADPSSYAGEHAPKLALDPRLPGWTGELRLSSLDSLRERRQPSFAVDFLDSQQIALVAMRSAHLFNAPVSRLLIHRSHAAVRNRRRGNGRLLTSSRRGLLRMGPVHVHNAHALAVWGFVGLWMCRGRRRQVLVLWVRSGVMPVYRACRIGMWSVMGPCARWVFLVSRGVHGGVVRSSHRLIPGPVPVSGVRGTAVLLCPLFHLPCVILLVHPV
jgi:hypothetical protein